MNIGKRTGIGIDCVLANHDAVPFQDVWEAATEATFVWRKSESKRVPKPPTAICGKLKSLKEFAEAVFPVFPSSQTFP